MIIDGTKKEEDKPTLASAGGGTLSTATTSTNAQKPTSSGRFTNLQKYIDANRGGNNQTLNKAKSDIGQLESDYGKSRASLSDVASKAREGYGKASDIQNYQRSIADNPNQNVDVNKFNQSYTLDPNYINQYEQKRNALNAYNEPRQSLAQINTQGGIRNYLQSIRGNRPGSAGGESLDTFLLSQPESIGTLNEISNRASAIDTKAGAQELEGLRSQYNELSQYDPEATKETLSRNMANLKVNQSDQDSVNRYNALQSILGGQSIQYAPGNAMTKDENLDEIMRYGGQGAVNAYNTQKYGNSQYMNDAYKFNQAYNPELDVWRK